MLLEAALAWVVVASVVDLALCVWDKRQARGGRSRVPERALLGIALAGGSPGLIVGMLLARHKTRKASFLLALLLILALQGLLLGWVLR